MSSQDGREDRDGGGKCLGKIREKSNNVQGPLVVPLM